MQPQVPDEKILRHRSFEGLKIAPAPNCLQSLGRYWQTAICTFAAPQQRQKAYFYKNADAGQLIFIHEGCGTLKTVYGNIAFGYGDYFLFPRGTIYQMHFDGQAYGQLIIEFISPIRFPKK